MKKFQKFLVFAATLFGAWMLFGNADQAHAIVSTTRPACAFEANNYTISVNWTEGSAPLGYYIVDISTDPSFNYVWNMSVAAGNFSVSNVPVGFTDSPWDAGVNPTPTLGLVAGTTYYVRLYNGVHNPNSAPGLAFSVPECAPPGTPSFSGLPVCATTAGYSGVAISWGAGGGSNPAYGYYVDISDNNFGRWWTKNVNSGRNTTSPTGFNGYSGVAGPMGNFAAGVTYSVRIFNGEHSVTRTFSVASCPIPTCSNTGPNNFTVPYGVNSHTMYITTTNASAVNFAVIPPASAPVWFAGVQTAPGYYEVTIDLSTFPLYGAYTVDVYMNNAGYTNIGCSFHPNFTREAPVAPSCTGGATPDTFVTYDVNGMHTITASGVHPSVTSVRMFIWDTSGGQGDDMIEYRPTTAPYAVTKTSATTWSLTFDYGAHPALGQVNVHVYMDNPMGTGFCDTANFQRELRPKPTITAVTKSTTAPCIDPASTYTVNIAWTGQPRPAGSPLYTGFYVDAGNDPALNNFWNKNVSPTTFSTQAGTGFAPYTGVAGSLSLVADVNYYFRVYNDSHSDIFGPVSIPRCGNLKVEVSQPGGSWTLTGPGGIVKNGTGAQTFSPAACTADSYYCIPVGSYTMTPTPNSPAGFNGTPTPASVNAN